LENAIVSELIISVSGLRGIVGETLTPDVAVRYTGAFAGTLPEGPVVVTRDGRSTGQMLAHCLFGCLCAAGRDVIDAGIAATPTTGVLIRKHNAAGGIQISASHNPPAYNGLKLFGSNGRILTASAGEPVTQRYRSSETAWAAHDRVGKVMPCEDTISEHGALVLATVDVERIRSRRFKVFLDSNHYSSSFLGRYLLEQLGCDLIHAGAKPDGCFSHALEPTEENLRAECSRVIAAGADVGFFPDPDGDRLAVVDETGRYVGEEYTLALCVEHILRKNPGPVVTNVATSRMAEDICQRYGVPFARAPVGEANVVEAILAHNAVIGGEGNGGAIDPRVGYVRDSFVGMAQILDYMAEREIKLSRLVDELPRYHIEKRKLKLDRKELPGAIEVIKQHFPDARLDESAGTRFVWGDKWLLLHPSNTEPVIRLIAETRSADETNALCDKAAQALYVTKH